MSETDPVLTDLCLVTAVDVETKVVNGLLFEERGSGEWGVESGEKRRRSFSRSPLPTPHSSEEPQLKIRGGPSDARRITVLKSDMGAVGFAERLERHLLDNHYDALIVVGLAGGLDPALRPGDVVLYDLCYDARAVEFWRDEEAAPEAESSGACDTRLSNFLAEVLTGSGVSFVRAPGITVDRIVTEARDKLALGARFGAAAVDMESCESLIACARTGLPAAVLRVISDEAGQDIPDFNRAYDANGRMNGWRMAAAMSARPIAALRLALSFRRAIGSLRETLRAVLDA
jgi:nucleoside phosphorylase